MSSRHASNRTAASSSTNGSMTVTTTDAQPALPFNLTQRTLRLRAEPEIQAEQPPRRRIQWAEDVVDNEGMGKKSSKVCCIYHKPREVGESSSDDSSSSSSDESDSEPDTSRAQPLKRSAGSQRDRHHDHHHDDPEGEGDDASRPSSASEGHRQNGKGKSKARRNSPNAYEQVPRQGT